MRNPECLTYRGRYRYASVSLNCLPQIIGNLWGRFLDIKESSFDCFYTVNLHKSNKNKSSRILSCETAEKIEFVFMTEDCLGSGTTGVENILFCLTLSHFKKYKEPKKEAKSKRGSFCRSFRMTGGREWASAQGKKNLSGFSRCRPIPPMNGSMIFEEAHLNDL